MVPKPWLYALPTPSNITNSGNPSRFTTERMVVNLPLYGIRYERIECQTNGRATGRIPKGEAIESRLPVFSVLSRSS
jgi:hypothetical protein